MRAAQGAVMGAWKAVAWGTALLLAAAQLDGQHIDPAPTPGDSTVRAVLFFSTTCPHCRDVVEDHLVPMVDRYGDRLQIAAVNTASQAGQELYQAVVLHFNIPRPRIGVPTLVVGSTVLVGSLEIPRDLPGIVDRGIVAGGIDWPPVPRIRQAFHTAPTEPQPTSDAAPPPRSDDARPAEARTEPAPEPAPVEETGPAPAPGTPEDHASAAEDRSLNIASHLGAPRSLSVRDRFLLDPVGNSASVAVLLILVAALLAGSSPLVGRRRWAPALPGWATPALAAVGLGVAAYMAFVEVSGAQAVCGPVGDCNTVQQSEYARLLGVPVGVLGVGGYAALIVGWTLSAFGPVRWNGTMTRALWAMALLATLFSIYLTFLEPFVIGATCAWCLSSALLAALILLSTTAAVARHSDQGLRPASDAQPSA
jgi:uncharacterized membrane protein